MLASPTIHEIASALARTPSPRPIRARESSRILCLCLKSQELPASGFKRSGRTGSNEAVAEAFLKYSPRVQFRKNLKSLSEDGVLWVFLDIASTSHLYHGEEALMRSCMGLARDLGFSAQCAVADTPSGAQAFATSHHGTVVPPGEERDRLKDLSLPLLLHLEGLVPWPKTSAVESMITFFMMLGFKKAGDLSRFTLTSFEERWGELGGLLWKRVNAQDRQVISPLIPNEPLDDYMHLDFPIALTSLLLHQVQKSLEFLFARLQGRRLFAQKLILTLHCEYSKTQHRIELEPASPSRDRDLFLTLLEQRISGVSLENPIRDFEVSILSCPEKMQQFDFFEPRNSDRDKLQNLFSLVGQAQIQPGLYHIEAAVLPEQGWRLAAHSAVPKETSSRLAAIAGDLSTPAVAATPHYGEAVMRAPRPTRILKQPRALSLEELEDLKILSAKPIERLENGWWNSDGGVARDYYFAVSPRGDCLWIYQDMKSEDYFLHGYFD